MDQDPTPLQDGWGGEAGGSEQLEQLERLICRLEARRAASCDLDEGQQPPSSPTTPRALTPTSAPTSRSYNFWRDVSPQLSYIDGSTTSSGGPVHYGRSVSWNLTDLQGPKAFLGEFDQSCNNLDKPGQNRPSSELDITPPALPALKPLSRYASDSICSPTAPPNAQHAVVQVEKGDIKTKIQKRLSFGDTLDLSTNIYTPAEDDGEGMTTGIGDSGTGTAATVNGSSTSLERKWPSSEEEQSCPPLVRRKSLDTQSQYSYYMDKDLRYYFQHPWLRLIVAYLVIFCNFLLFAEDPVSHSHTGKFKFNLLHFLFERLSKVCLYFYFFQ